MVQNFKQNRRERNVRTSHQISSNTFTFKVLIVSRPDPTSGTWQPPQQLGEGRTPYNTLAAARLKIIC